MKRSISLGASVCYFKRPYIKLILQLGSRTVFHVEDTNVASGSALDTELPKDALSLLKEALSKCLKGLPSTESDQSSFDNLVIALQHFENQMPQLPDGEQGLDEAIDEEEETIQCFIQALQYFSPNHEYRGILLKQVIQAFGERGFRTANLEDLDRATEYAQEFLQLQPLEHPEHLAALEVLIEICGRRYQVGREAVDLDKLVEYCQRALEVEGSSLPRSNFLVSLLLNRFQDTGRIENLKMVNEHYHLHLRCVYHDVPHNPKFCSMNIAECFEEAIQLHHRKLELLPPSDPYHIHALINLARIFHLRFDSLKDAEDLDKAIELSRKASELDPTQSYDDTLDQLSDTIIARFEISWGKEDINEALDLRRRVVNLTSHNNRSERVSRLGRLGDALFQRSDPNNRMRDIEEAIQLYREALDLMPYMHPLRYHYLNSLSRFLYTRYEHTRGEEHKDEALDFHTQALESLAPGEPNPNPSLEMLARAVASGTGPLSGYTDNFILDVRCYRLPCL